MRDLFNRESFGDSSGRVIFKYTKKKTGTGQRIFLMSPLHHHYQKKGWYETKNRNTILDYSDCYGRIFNHNPKNPMMDKPTYSLSTFIVVLGGGESGVGAAILASQKATRFLLAIL